MNNEPSTDQPVVIATETVVAPAAPADTVTVAARPFNIVVLEGILYFVISALPPVTMLLEGDKILSARVIIAALLVGLIQGCISLKAFFSQSTSKKNNP